MIAFLILVGALAGSIPGLVMWQFGSRRIGILLMLLGALMGAVIACEKWLERSALKAPPDEPPTDLMRLLGRWLKGSGAGNRRDRWVIAAFVLGLVAGAAVVIRDVRRLHAAAGVVGPAAETIVLPLEGAKDPLVWQAITTSLACGLWTAAVVGVLASTVYRRRILFAVLITSYLGGCIGFAADDGRGHIGRGVTYLVTYAILVALLATVTEMRTQVAIPEHGPQ